MKFHVHVQCTNYGCKFKLRNTIAYVPVHVHVQPVHVDVQDQLLCVHISTLDIRPHISFIHVPMPKAFHQIIENRGIHRIWVKGAKFQWDKQ